MQNLSNAAPIIHQQDIEALAYQLWWQANCPPERTLDFWLAAEQKLVSQHLAAIGPFSKAAQADDGPFHVGTQKGSRPATKGAAKKPAQSAVQAAWITG
jgi:hypothetical protein